MADTHGFIRLPPDGSGKRVPQSVMLEFDFDSGTVPIDVGDILSFGTSTFTGVVVEEAESDISGELHIRIPDPVPTNIVLVGGEDIFVNGQKVAQVASNPGSTPYYFQQNVIAGGENMINLMDVSERGEAKIAYAEGTLQFDSFGRLETSEYIPIAEYIMTYDELPNTFSDFIAGASPPTLVHSQLTKGVTLTTDTDASDSYRRTSDKYHLYQAGTSLLGTFTCACGDSGKTNVRRNWGLYDDQDGIMFRLDGTQLQVVLRSSSTGSVVETVINQSDWNGDRLDGSLDKVFNLTRQTIDITKMSLFWMDFQWMGAGRIRFGVELGGDRVTCHEIKNANKNFIPYMKTGSLPMSYEITNTGITASPSTFNFYCGTVLRGGVWRPELGRAAADNTESITTTTPTHLMTIQNKQTYAGKDNRGWLDLKAFYIYNDADAPVKITMLYNAVLSGAVFADANPISFAEVDTTGTILGGLLVRTVLVSPKTTLEVSPPREAYLYRKADITQSNSLTIAAELLTAGAGGNVTLVMNWDEAQD